MTNPIIGFAGLPGSGKDCAARILINEHRYTRMAFADVLKRDLLAINPALNHEDLNQENLKDKRMGKLKIRSFDREWGLKQTVTLVADILRRDDDDPEPVSLCDMFNQKLMRTLTTQGHGYLDLLTPRDWMRAYSDAIKDWHNDQLYFMRQTAVEVEQKLEQGANIVFSDVRYIHEFDFIISAYGGLVAHIDRPNRVKSDHESDNDNSGRATHIIQNTGSLGAFERNVRKFIGEVVK